MNDKLVLISIAISNWMSRSLQEITDITNLVIHDIIQILNNVIWD